MLTLIPSEFTNRPTVVLDEIISAVSARIAAIAGACHNEKIVDVGQIFQERVVMLE